MLPRGQRSPGRARHIPFACRVGSLLLFSRGQGHAGRHVGKCRPSNSHATLFWKYDGLNNMIGTVIGQLAQAILLGGLYSMFAMGLSISVGVMRFVNIAHGDLIVLMSYVLLSTTILL